MTTEAPLLENKHKESTFSSLAHLDVRILRALADQSFVKPTLVQAKAIPLALEGKDILCRAKTGSGKTVAYCVPVLERVLVARKVATTEDEKQTTRAVVLVPTRELAEQVTAQMKKLAKYCEGVAITNVAGGGTNHLNKMILSDRPDIVIGTPARILGLVQSKALSLQSLEVLVIDEADLILSYGHAQTMQTLLSSSSTSTAQPTEEVSQEGTSKQKGQGYLPPIYQSLLMSATLTADVKTLKSLVLRNPVILTLTEEEAEESKNLLSEYVIHLPTEADKFLHIYVILKLKLIKGKAILFVNDVERCYRLKLFLEQFSVRCCVLNRELPINSRYHTIQEFNKGVYDYIIATDEAGGKNEEQDSDGEDAVEAIEIDVDVEDGLAQTQRAVPAEESISNPDKESSSNTKKRKRDQYEPMEVEEEQPKEEDEAEEAVPEKKNKKKKASRITDKEYSTSRGIDFVDVSCVVNFDLPLSHRSYVHRVGRTARAGRGGVAVSFVVASGSDQSKRSKGNENDEERMWRKIEQKQNNWSKKTASAPVEERPESCIKPFVLAPSLLAGFKYRMEDALRSVTSKAVKEARVKELKAEVLNSGKLKAHFEDNPLDLEYLRHDKPLHPARVQTHMKYVPSYLLPKGVKASKAGLTSIECSTDASQEGGASKFDGAIASGVLSSGTGDNLGFVPFHKRGGARGRGRGGFGSRGRGSGNRHGGKRKNDPLRKFGA